MHAVSLEKSASRIAQLRQSMFTPTSCVTSLISFAAGNNSAVDLRNIKTNGANWTHVSLLTVSRHTTPRYHYACHTSSQEGNIFDYLHKM